MTAKEPQSAPCTPAQIHLRGQLIVLRSSSPSARALSPVSVSDLTDNPGKEGGYLGKFSLGMGHWPLRTLPLHNLFFGQS